MHYSNNSIAIITFRKIKLNYGLNKKHWILRAVVGLSFYYCALYLGDDEIMTLFTEEHALQVFCTHLADE